jgi:hypothetical protein
VEPRSTPVRRPARRGIVGVLLLAVLSGCSSLAPDAAAAAAVAADFHRAVAAGDGSAACVLLAPETASVVAQDADQSCPVAVLQQDVPDGGAVLSRAAYGQVAQVVMAGDVVFLAAFGDRWRVTAAGCSPRENRPYHCLIEGG